MTSVRIFQDAQAIDSLRNSDFDAHSAYGEVIDNSIQAGARHVRIKFSVDSGSKQAAAIRSVAFGDDGEGMLPETLHRCLQIGWSSRYDNRDGIGRFGVGMTLGAIHECKLVEVWSRSRGASTWHRVVMDLDDMGSGGEAGLAEPEPRTSLPAEYAGLVGGAQHGTLVVWSKYDRWHGSKKDVEEMIAEFHVYCGRTYRNFIMSDNGLELFIDGNKVAAIDPLYARTESTKFPDDPRAEVYPDIELPWPRDDGKGTDKIVIRLSLLPVELRRDRGDGGKEPAKARYIDRNEGFSMLRNNREVFYGELPHWGAGPIRWKFEEVDRWWGCEILVPASLDSAFVVKNIKRGAQPIPRLREKLKELITPTRNSAIEKVRANWDAEKLKKDAGLDLGGGTSFATGHERAQGIVADTKTPKGRLDKDVDRDKSQDAVLATLKHYNDIQKECLKKLFESQPFTIINDTWPGTDFLEANYMGGVALLKYNTRHDFHRKTAELMDQLIKTPDSAPQVAERLKTLIDLTFISYAKAETMFSQDDTLTAEQFIEYMRSHWGKYLQVYVQSWEKAGS